MSLWNEKIEKLFFTEALKNFASPEQLFYTIDSKHYAYIPKNISGKGQTLQSRNSLIGQFTEKWTKEFLSKIAINNNLCAINGVVCEEIGLSKRSNADLAFCTTDDIVQKPQNIKLLFEIKMSIVSNYKLTDSNEIVYIGDYKTHTGNPSLLRSDSMLKAIGKSINIRVSSIESTTIPIIVLGNSPITKNYSEKVDFLKSAGVIQGFWSLNPKPTSSKHIRSTPNNGFQTVENYEMISDLINDILKQEMNYFSSMINKLKLGEIIRIAGKEAGDEAKATKFLQLIREIK